ncbi:Rha family transcriptional regulator [uncultured Clostridium sp.]|uniref:Rha family transcriptional regulator n=1 Tax=uncultured Clostridium sp. TaxID=59620 RepID=UPI0028E29C87|nr:Rha family transcriptional regulator [uncultured Clostridium sp.]
MNNLINILNKNGQLVVTSRQIAIDFNKRHGDVLEKVDSLINEMISTEKSVQYFIQDSYKDDSGKSNREYLLTRDGFSLLVMGFTGSKALEWKLKYIEAFNRMEEHIKNQNMPTSFEDMMILQLQEQKKLKSRVENIEDKLESLEVNPSQRKTIQSLKHKRVVELLGGRKTKAYLDRSFRSRVYSDLGREYLKYFDIPSYELTPKNRFSEALEVVESYNLSTELAMELKKVNNQITF